MLGGRCILRNDLKSGRAHIVKEIAKLTSTSAHLPDQLKTPSVAQFPTYLKGIESKWRIKVGRRFDRERYVGDKQEKTNDKLPRYILSMFPYPSGRLHLGHVRIYTSSDLLTRYSRLISKNKNHPVDFSYVINPMGFDSFGLPAENAAKERGLNPAVWTNSNIRVMKKQLDDLAIQFDWREATSNPSFYKWTQDIFLKLMDAGLVYKSFAQVNWDPVDETVLADEQVDEDGYSWRSGAKVEKRNYRQWFIKVNAFTDEIYKAEHVDRASWQDILAIQRNWIGKPCGWLFYIPIPNHKSGTPDILPIFTEYPELFTFPDTKLLISGDHWLQQIHDISKFGAIDNPFTGHRMEVSLVEDADKLPQSTKATLIKPRYFQDSVDSIENRKINREQVLLIARLKNLGGYYTSDKYRDWLISRQRFWGTPIPVINCKQCGLQGVNRENLPIKLPEVKNLANTNCSRIGSSDKDRIVPPIENLAPDDWLEVGCPTCGRRSKRECETFDTLFDSSWYFLRYATSPPPTEAFDSKRVQPVWCYIGGKEHASMHLFYARFITHFLHSRGEIKFKEPFGKLLVQGVVKGRTHKLNGKYLSQDELQALSDKSQVTVDYEKMSKSKGNGVDPQHLIDKYGCDATRLCLMSYANPRTERLWRSEEEEFKDVVLFLRRMMLTVQEYIGIGNSLRSSENSCPKVKELDESELSTQKILMNRALNKCAIDSSFHIEKTNQFRQYISSLHSLLNAIRPGIKTSVVFTREYAEALAALIVMLNPLTPHFTEELWSHFSKAIINPLRTDQTSPYDVSLQVGDQPWPVPARGELEARAEVAQTEREKKKRRYKEKKSDNE